MSFFRRRRWRRVCLNRQLGLWYGVIAVSRGNMGDKVLTVREFNLQQLHGSRYESMCVIM